MSDSLALGIDLGGTDIKVGIVTSAGGLCEFFSRPTPKTSSNDIVREIVEIINETEARYHSLMTVGIGVPAVFDTQKKEVVIAPNLVSKDFPLRMEVEKASRKNIVMNNDANMAAVGEWWQGAGKSFNKLALITLGTGIGAGIILDGKIFSGGHGWAGEIGHTIIIPDGELCSCGKKGCLEAYASAAAIARRYAAKGHAWITPQEVFIAAKEKNEDARAVISEAIETLSLAIYNFTLMFDVDAVILGGGMTNAGDQLMLPLNKQIDDLFKVYPGKKLTTIRKAALENKAGVLGAAKAALDMNNF